MNGVEVHGFLVMMHCESNAGYAISPLEKLFFRSGLELTGNDPQRIHFTYPSLASGAPRNLDLDPDQVRQFDFRTRARNQHDAMADYIRHNRIDTVLGFDLSPNAPSLAPLRQAGVRTLISYLGAPMSSLNGGPKLWAKRLEMALRRHAPDHYLFESEAMRRTATHGRGVPAHRTSLVHLGVDTSVFTGPPASTTYAHREFDIPEHRRIVFYSGHMEPRKGVHVIMQAAHELVVERGRQDVHFLLVGNRPGEETSLLEPIRETSAAAHVTFGGYRDDLPQLHTSCYAGVIASTGWDSFTCSALEMAASGLPLIVSRLQGLMETVEDEKTGLLFEPGDAHELANRLELLLDDPARHAALSRGARERTIREFSRERQRETLTRELRRIVEARATHGGGQ